MAADSGKKVETASRLARWRIGELASRSLHHSDLFNIGSAWWRMETETKGSAFVKLYLFSSLTTTSSRLLASFNLRVLYFCGDPKSLLYSEVKDKDFRAGDSFVWQIVMPLSGKIIIDVEFSDLKSAPASDKVPRSIWKPSNIPYFPDNGAVNSSVGRMMNQRILTDVDILTSDGGSLRAHRAILATRSPVFKTMFTNKLKEKTVTAVSMSNMSSESGKAFLNYIYGTISQDEFHAHRIPLLGAADKYGVTDLKEECEKGLMEDIKMENVVERMQMAKGYGLNDLKRECLRFLVRFGKICDVKDEFSEFFNGADREVVFEVFREVVAAWMSF